MAEVFITSTLKSEWNKEYNPILCAALEDRGISCYLPQRDTNQSGSVDEVCRQNLEGIKNAGKILVVAANESPNWGVEVGYAYAIGKKLIMLTTEDHNLPKMASGMGWEYLRVKDLDDVHSYIDSLVELIKE